MSVFIRSVSGPLTARRRGVQTANGVRVPPCGDNMQVNGTRVPGAALASMSSGSASNSTRSVFSVAVSVMALRPDAVPVRGSRSSGTPMSGKKRGGWPDPCACGWGRGR